MKYLKMIKQKTLRQNSHKLYMETQKHILR